MASFNLETSKAERKVWLVKVFCLGHLSKILAPIYIKALKRPLLVYLTKLLYNLRNIVGHMW